MTTAEEDVTRLKRRGNYIPERLKLIEEQIAHRYALGESATALAQEYGISKHGVFGAVERQGGVKRGKSEAGLLYRTVDYSISSDEQADSRPIAQQVAEKLGYSTHKGLSRDRAFQTAVAKERRRRAEDKYRAMDKKRKTNLYRIPKWQDRKEPVAFYDMAHDLGLEVDHVIPLDGDNICGLNVIGNLALIHPKKNGTKHNRCDMVSDYLVGPPRVLARVLKNDRRMLSGV